MYILFLTSLLDILHSNDAGALYDYFEIMLLGIPNHADSLEVIRKFVYAEKKYTLAEMKKILENDFSDESVRREFINKAALTKAKHPLPLKKRYN